MAELNFRSFCTLMIDDDPVQRAVVTAMLRRLGVWQVIGTDNGETGWTLIDVAKPDLVICDIDMQPVHGFELLRRIRTSNSPVTRRLPVIMLSGLTASGTVMKASVLEADAYVTKPVQAETLKERIERVVRTPTGTAFRIDRTHLTDNSPGTVFQEAPARKSATSDPYEVKV